MSRRPGWFGFLLILIRRALPDRRSVVGLVLFFAVLFAGIAAGQSACYPWAHSLGLYPTLTGKWVGELTATGRGQHVALIDLRDDIGEEGPDIAGTVKVCDTRGETHEFGLLGNTLNWRGDRFHLTTFIKENRDGEGVQFEAVDGDWDRADVLRVTAKLRLWRIRGGGTFSSTDRSPAQIALEDTPVQFTFTRASETQFREACDRLRARKRAAPD